MDTPTKWITSTIERLLGSYLNKSSIKIPFENDQSNLRFRTDVVKSVLVNSCTEDRHFHKLNVTDSDAQIEAIFSREALEDYQKRYPQHPFSKEEVRGYRVQLEDFELVLEYTTATPKVHLYVQRFKVEWGSARVKTPPKGKTLRKHPVYKLMQDASRDAKQSLQHIMAPAPRRNDSFSSQTYQPFQLPASQNGFMSQVYPAPQAQAMQHPPHPDRSARVSTLLAMLDQRAGINIPSDQLGRVPSLPPIPDHQHGIAVPAAMANIPSARYYTAEPSRVNIDNAPLPFTVPSAAAQPVPRPSSNQFLRLASQPPLAKDSVSLSRVSRNSAPPHSEFEAERMPQLAGLSQKGTEKQTSSPLQMIQQPHRAVVKEKQPLEKLGLCLEDPWKDLTRIEERDIRIPKDQKDLLGLYKRRWIPPLPGESKPQGHVPPRLLAQWNTIVTRRSRAAGERSLEKAKPEALPLERPSLGPPSPTPRADSDSEGEPLTSQWSESSPEQTIRRRPALPEDSSPIRGSPRRLGRNVPVADRPKVQADRITEESILESDQRALSTVSEKPAGIAGQAKTCIHPARRSITVRAQSLRDDSDGDSDDSMMDTSVPCPLGVELSQSQFSSQLEREITSSGPSLPAPATQDQVQVVDTPETNLGRFRHSQPELGSKAPGTQPFSTQSPSVDKSSSQSRILNSVGSSTNKVSSSQSLPHDQSRGTNAEIRVDIAGTQMSNQDLSTQDPTPVSTADMVLDSSAPRLREASEIMEVAMPSSLPLETSGQKEASSEVLAQRSSNRHSVGVISKRSASALEDEACGPSKRHRTQPPEAAHEPASSALHRESPRNPADSWEAQQIYGKFCRNYPNYTGEFHHFTTLCSKLQAVRAKGHLQRSFLWDDFIIKHLEEFPGYIQQTQMSESKSMDYEDYFASTFSRPVYKKRSLTVQGIAIAAAQDDSAREDQEPAPVHASPSRPDTSFTGSLVNRFTNLHAHSFEPGSQATLSDTDMDISSVMSSPTPHRQPQSVAQEGDWNMTRHTEQMLTEEDASSDLASAERLVIPTSSASAYESALEYAPIHEDITVFEKGDTSESSGLEGGEIAEAATPTPGNQVSAVGTAQHEQHTGNHDMDDRDTTQTPADPTTVAESEQHASQVEESSMAVRDATATPAEPMTVAESEQHASQAEDNSMVDRDATPTPAESVPVVESEQHASQVEDRSMADRDVTPILAEPILAVQSQHESQTKGQTVADQAAETTVFEHVEISQIDELEGNQDVSMGEPESPDGSIMEDADNMVGQKSEPVAPEEHLEVISATNAAPSALEAHAKVPAEDAHAAVDQGVEEMDTEEHPASVIAPKEVTLEEQNELIVEDIPDTVGQEAEEIDLAEHLPPVAAADQAGPPAVGEQDQPQSHDTPDQESQDVDMAVESQESSILITQDPDGHGTAPLDLAEQSQAILAEDQARSPEPEQHNGSTGQSLHNTIDKEVERASSAKHLLSHAAGELNHSQSEQQDAPINQDAPTVDHRSRASKEQGEYDKSVIQGIQDSFDRENGAMDSAGTLHSIVAEDGVRLAQPEVQEAPFAGGTNDVPAQKADAINLAELGAVVAGDETVSAKQPLLEQPEPSDAETESADEEPRYPMVAVEVRAVENRSVKSEAPSDADVESDVEQVHSVLIGDEASAAEQALPGPAAHSDIDMESDTEILPFVLAEHAASSAEDALVEPAEHSDIVMESEVELLLFDDKEDHASSTEQAPVSPQIHSEIETAGPADPNATTESESEDDEENDDSMDIGNHHETASIELGDEPLSPPPTTRPPAQPETVSESESDTDDDDEINENWFLSLRHLRPTAPVWSDDPNTPFKQWVRADQAILSERDRRGGAYLPVDAKGCMRQYHKSASSQEQELLHPEEFDTKRPVAQSARWSSIALDSWFYESVAVCFSIACLIAIVCILLVYDQQKTPSLSYGLTLNAIVSILATGAKSALLFFCEPWTLGLTDLLRDQGRSFATLGALVTILSLVFDPFVPVNFGCNALHPSAWFTSLWALHDGELAENTEYASSRGEDDVRLD
ncbi:hypothetical protein ASPACDRAFT_40335 [Aspergillus aculeatus ATCC 16872]|uniref:Telomere replication protein EST3 n=1 Tax=Aspergillus aculeatus (strain ATCC 16872 / CBS 172.66 / WB 5094) TaxID=690307 RepID=A0A1L9X3G1_ASPA1|nr:uncharacterized protein ASPACDRAFT_40335 [Aspergillus aculeatus ATCC 16872]OJK03020.1 hypothetical protein ASPACDRAFT_40335 [Aspergillus aculeatus ATCC 16872]